MNIVYTDALKLLNEAKDKLKEASKLLDDTDTSTTSLDGMIDELEDEIRDVESDAEADEADHDGQATDEE